MSFTARFLPCAGALLLAASQAAAAPVATGSSYNLFFSSAAWDRSIVAGLTFDGIAESRLRTTTDPGGQARDIAFSVNESQLALGDGRYEIRIDVTAGEDLFPFNALVGFAFGTGGDDPLELAFPVRLLANEVSVFAGDVELASGDWAASTWALGQADPWDGYFLDATHFGAFFDLTGRGIDRIRFTVQVQELSQPAPAALLGLALAAAALQGARRQRERRRGFRTSIPE